MESLLYFGIWAGLIFLMMRYGCGAHVMGHGHGQTHPQEGDRSGAKDGERWIPPRKAVDPVCAKSVSTNRARPSVHGGEVYYFCSRECREVFEAAPELYVSAEEHQNGKMLEHSHG